MGEDSSGYFEVQWIGGRNESWGFWLKREDGKRVANGGGCDSQGEMEEGIAWIRANVQRVEILQDKGRQRRPPSNRRRPRLPMPQRWRFWLTDSNGKAIMMSLPCDSEEEADEAMEWVKTVVPHAEVRIVKPPTPEYEARRRRPRDLP